MRTFAPLTIRLSLMRISIISEGTVPGTTLNKRPDTTAEVCTSPSMSNILKYDNVIRKHKETDAGKLYASDYSL